MQVTVSVCRDQGGDPLAGFVKVLAILDHLGAKRGHARVFLGIVAARHHQDCLGAKQTRGIGDGETVVAAGGGNHAALFVCRGERSHEVDPTPYLECANRQVVLMFDEQFAARQGGEAGIAIDRGPRQVTAHHRTGSDNVSVGWVLHCSLFRRFADML